MAPIPHSPAVAEDEELVAFTNRLGCLPAEIVHRRSQSFRTFGHAEQHLQRFAFEMRIGNPRILCRSAFVKIGCFTRMRRATPDVHPSDWASGRCWW